MDHSKLAWKILSQSTGRYSGHGVNHEGQAFTSRFKLEAEMPGKMLSVAARASGEGGEVFHEEKSWIGRELSGALMLYVASNNHPAIAPHAFHRLEEREGARAVVFRFGDPDVRESFREEITFSFHTDGSLSHHYAWGMPGGDFAPRSGSRMQKN